MRRWLVLIVLVAVAAIVLGRLFWASYRGMSVTLAEVTRGRVVAAVYATGRVDSDERATVRARVAAPLAALLVGPGQPVHAGEVVARQDDAALRLALERAQGELEAARASSTQAQDEATRSEQLVHDGLLAEDGWVRAREMARQLAAQMGAMESAVRIAREQQSWTVLRAPVGGTVTALLHRAGDPLREGDDVLTVVDLARAYVRVAVDERDVGRIVPGQEMRLVFDAYPGQVLKGTVWRIVPAVDRLTKSSDVLAQLPPERPPLQLDLTATVNIVTGVIENAVTVPREALEGAGAHRRVYVVGAGSRAERREVEIGACDEQRCEVTAGVAAGAKVISPLPPGFKERVKVRPQ